jgi:hypothetical protein
MKLLVALVAALTAPAAGAAPFADPFRPPRQIEQPVVDDGPKGPASSRLESVLIGPDRRIAVISGQQYLEGERFGTGRVLRISESEVVIRHPDRDEKLTMFAEGGRRVNAAKGRK